MTGSKLAGRIVFVVAHGGVAGISGTQYEIETDGSWKAYSYLGSRTGGVIDSGNLSKQSQGEIAQLFDTHNFSELPPRVGVLTVNPPYTVLEYEGVRCEGYISPHDTGRNYDLAAESLRDIASGVLSVIQRA